MQKKTPSRLSARQQRTLLVVVALGVFMVADTLYLLTNRLADAFDFAYFAVTDISLPKFYQGMVLSHTGVGLVLVVLAMGFVAWHLPAVWRKSRKRAILTGIATLTLGIVLAVSGLFILSAASNRGNPVAYWSHVACGGFSAPLLLGAPPPLAVEARRTDLSHRAHSGGRTVGAGRGAARVDL